MNNSHSRNKNSDSIFLVTENQNPQWNWLGLDFNGYRWQHHRASRNRLSRIKCAFRVYLSSLFRPPRAVVSHSPLISLSVALFPKRAYHIAFSFNFTDLPNGVRRSIFSFFLKKVDQFIVFTEYERSLYSSYFDLEIKKFKTIPWGVAPPIANIELRESRKSKYYISIGGEARDYFCLFEAARLTPDINYLVICRPHNVFQLTPPPNVEIRLNLPYKEVWDLASHAKALIIPLISQSTPCGIVTVVAGMHLGIAQIITRSAGIEEYCTPECAVFVRPGVPIDIAQAVRKLENQPELRNKMAAEGMSRAENQYSERVTQKYVKILLETAFQQVA